MILKFLALRLSGISSRARPREPLQARLRQGTDILFFVAFKERSFFKSILECGS